MHAKRERKRHIIYFEAKLAEDLKGDGKLRDISKIIIIIIKIDAIYMELK